MVGEVLHLEYKHESRVLMFHVKHLRMVTGDWFGKEIDMNRIN